MAFMIAFVSHMHDPFLPHLTWPLPLLLKRLASAVDNFLKRIYCANIANFSKIGYFSKIADFSKIANILKIANFLKIVYFSKIVSLYNLFSRNGQFSRNEVEGTGPFIIV